MRSPAIKNALDHHRSIYYTVLVDLYSNVRRVGCTFCCGPIVNKTEGEKVDELQKKLELDLSCCNTL